MKLNLTPMLFIALALCTSQAFAQDHGDKQKSDHTQKTDTRTKGNQTKTNPPRQETKPITRTPSSPSHPVSPLPDHKVNAPQPTSRGPVKSDSNAGSYQKPRPTTRPGGVASHPINRNGTPAPTFDRHPEGGGWDHDGHRQGFEPRSPGFRIDQFNFRHYQDRWDEHSLPSPGYFYSSLPGFLLLQFTFAASNHAFAWEVGSPYRWEWHHHEYDGVASLDSSVDRIQDCFVHRSVSELTPLLPGNKSVDIEFVGQSRYGVSGSDFQNMLGDVVTSTDTISYTVADVWRNGKSATVVAEHEYRDSSGATFRQRHWYGLRVSGYGYRIVSFRAEMM